jgi:thiamine-phosphate pyrophosphorylase
VDHKLLAWGRAAACRAGTTGIPVLWLFTDSKRLRDPLAAAARLPRGIAGVVLRHDDDPHRAALARALARICRERRLALVVAGDVRLAARVGAGVHLRAGRWPAQLRRRGMVTSSAHSVAELRRAHRAGASLAFLSPVFPTRSHPSAPSLGACRWSLMARRAGLPVAALGGVDGQTVLRLLPGICRAVGAIGALG